MPEKEARPTQEFVEIDRVENGVLILKNRALRQILLVSGVNFDLKSEEEQNLIIGAYQTLLNGLRFSFQIFVHSRRINIESYLAKLEARQGEEPSELLRNQITEYVQFIRSFVSQNPIMTKSFFVVVPFDPIVIPGAESKAGKKLFGLFKRSAPQDDVEAKNHAMRENRGQLSQRVSQIVAAIAQIGLRAVPLEDAEVVELFYNLYNPESKEKKGGEYLKI